MTHLMATVQLRLVPSEDLALPASGPVIIIGYSVDADLVDRAQQDRPGRLGVDLLRGADRRLLGLAGGAPPGTEPDVGDEPGQLLTEPVVEVSAVLGEPCRGVGPHARAELVRLRAQVRARHHAPPSGAAAGAPGLRSSTAAGGSSR